MGQSIPVPFKLKRKTGTDSRRAVAVAQLKSCIMKLEATYLEATGFLIRFPTQTEIDDLSALIQQLKKLLGAKKIGGVFMGRNARAVDKRYKKLELDAFIEKLYDRVLAGGCSPITRLRKQIANDPAREKLDIVMDIIEWGSVEESYHLLIPWETVYEAMSDLVSVPFQSMVAFVKNDARFRPASPPSAFDVELKRFLGFSAMGDLMLRQHQWQILVEPVVRPSVRWLASLDDPYYFPELRWFLDRPMPTPKQVKKSLKKLHALHRQQKCRKGISKKRDARSWYSRSSAFIPS